MKDNSKILYDKYFEFKNRTIKLILKNDRILIGQIIGYFKGDEEAGESCIMKWHFISKTEKKGLGVDAFGYLIGEVIDQSDIKSIHFEEDNSTLYFII